jgi:hypothetical protein
MNSAALHTPGLRSSFATGIGNRRDHGVEAEGGWGDVHEVERPRHLGYVPRPDVDGDHCAPDDGVASGQFVEQAAGEHGPRKVPYDAMSADERNGLERRPHLAVSAWKAAALVTRRAVADLRPSGKAWANEGSVSGGRSGAESMREKSAIAGGVHVGGQRRQAMVAGGHGFWSSAAWARRARVRMLCLRRVKYCFLKWETVASDGEHCLQDTVHRTHC